MPEIQTIAVIGAGAIGRGIAFAAALGGYRTILEDILPSSLRTAAAELREHLASAADLGTVSRAGGAGRIQSSGICLDGGTCRARG